MKPLVHKKAKRVRHEAPVRVKLHVAKGDTVRVISGDDKGKRGQIAPGVPEDRSRGGRGREHDQEAPARDARPPRRDHRARGADPSLQGDADRPEDGEPTRIRRRRDADGTVERVGVKSGQSIPRSR